MNPFFIRRANMGHIPFQTVESSMTKARREALPKNPTTIKEINDLFETENVRENFGLAKRPKNEAESTSGDASNGDAPNRDAPNDDEKKPTGVKFFHGAYEFGEIEYCVFAAEDTVKIVEDAIQEVNRKTLYVDGTFKICPEVLILFAEVFGHVSYLFYCLN